MSRFEIFFTAYLEAAAFADTPEDHMNQGLEFNAKSKLLAEKDCKAFLDANHELIGADQFEQAGHDFWFTRKGHGVGFWDRPEIYGEEKAKLLTEASKKFSECIHVDVKGRNENRRLYFY
jgi:hypothetical protein